MLGAGCWQAEGAPEERGGVPRCSEVELQDGTRTAEDGGGRMVTARNRPLQLAPRPCAAPGTALTSRRCLATA